MYGNTHPHHTEALNCGITTPFQPTSTYHVSVGTSFGGEFLTGIGN